MDHMLPFVGLKLLPLIFSSERFGAGEGEPSFLWITTDKKGYVK
jgi:hypothetical protein